jgi:hypothetical protein
MADAKGRLERDFPPTLAVAWTRLLRALDYISFGNGTTSSGNMDACWVNFNTGVANSELAIAHTLKRIPIGYLPVSYSQACVIYTGAGTWTTSTIFVRGNVASTNVRMLVF